MKTKYYCKKCKSYHYPDSVKGKEHSKNRMSDKQLSEEHKKEWRNKFRGYKAKMLFNDGWIPITLTGNRKPWYIEVKGKGWIHQSLIDLGGSSKYVLQKKRYELKPNEKGFWEK